MKQIAWLSQWLREIIMVILLAAFIDLLLPNRMMQRYMKLILSLIILLILLSPIIKLFDANLTDEISAEWEKAAADSPAVYESLTSIQREAARMTSSRNSEVLSVAAAQLETNIKAELQQSIRTLQVNSASATGQENVPVFAVQDKRADVSDVDVKLQQDSTGSPYIDSILVHLSWREEIASTAEQESKKQPSGGITPIEKVEPVQIDGNRSSDTSDSSMSNHARTSADAEEAYQQSIEEQVAKQLTTQWLVKTEQIQFRWSV